MVAAQNPCKSRFISNSSHCSTTILFKHITSTLTAVKDHVIKYIETAFSNSNDNYFRSIKTLLRSSKCYGCETFRVLKCLLLIFQLYTHHCHVILSTQNCCLLLNGVSTESQKLTSVRQIRPDFSPTRNMTRIDVHVDLHCSFYFLMENTYVQFDDMVYQQIVLTPMGTNCAPLITEAYRYHTVVVL